METWYSALERGQCCGLRFGRKAKGRSPLRNFAPSFPISEDLARPPDRNYFVTSEPAGNLRTLRPALSWLSRGHGLLQELFRFCPMAFSVLNTAVSSVAGSRDSSFLLSPSGRSLCR